jgi:DNA-binding SARP family transcriptional activator
MHLETSSPVVRVLGGLSLVSGERRLAVPPGSRRLLAYLALRPVGVDRRCAAGVLWPTVDDGRAAGNLRSALWRLQSVDCRLVQAAQSGLALHDDVEVDLARLEEWAGRVLAGTPDETDLAVDPGPIAELELLPGWYDDWVLGERDRLRQRLLHALEVMSGRLAADRPGEAVSAALVAVAAEPLRESAQRALIEAHIAHGNWGEAAHQFAAYRRLLADELGVEPHPALTGLLRPVLGSRRSA